MPSLPSRSGTCAALPRPLHPPHGHQQPPPDSLRRRARQLPLRDYAHGSKQRVMPLTPWSSCAAFSCTFCPRFRAHPPLCLLSNRFRKQLLPLRAHSSPPRPRATPFAALAQLRTLALPPLRRTHARHPRFTAAQLYFAGFDSSYDRYQPGLWTCSRHAIPLCVQPPFSAVSVPSVCTKLRSKATYQSDQLPSSSLPSRLSDPLPVPEPYSKSIIPPITPPKRLRFLLPPNQTLHLISTPAILPRRFRSLVLAVARLR